MGAAAGEADVSGGGAAGRGGAAGDCVRRCWRCGVLVALLPAYEGAINELLPVLLGIFLWYSMLGFLVLYGDLQERPWVGAVLWGVAVGVQAGVIFVPGLMGVRLGGADAAWTVVGASGLGLGLAAVVAAPAFLWRPARMTASATPVGVLLLSVCTFFAPWWVVGDLVAGVTVVGLGLCGRRVCWCGSGSGGRCGGGCGRRLEGGDALAARFGHRVAEARRTHRGGNARGVISRAMTSAFF